MVVLKRRVPHLAWGLNFSASASSTSAARPHHISILMRCFGRRLLQRSKRQASSGAKLSQHLLCFVHSCIYAATSEEKEKRIDGRSSAFAAFFGFFVCAVLY